MRWFDLMGLSDEELAKTHDQLAVGTGASLNLVRDELMRRELQRSADASRQLAEQAVEEARLQRLTSEANLRVARTAMWIAVAALIATAAAIVVPLLVR